MRLSFPRRLTGLRPRRVLSTAALAGSVFFTGSALAQEDAKSPPRPDDPKGDVWRNNDKTEPAKEQSGEAKDDTEYKGHGEGGDVSKCPVMGVGEAFNRLRPTSFGTYGNDDWWPNALNVGILHQNSAKSNPLGTDFDYAAEFAKVDLEELKKDTVAALRDSQDWWPADYGHYGPFMIRMAWHSAGTYRVTDGRGGASDGTQRFAPLNSWPDNGNLDKARRILWPVKQKYGNSVSWADLMVFAGNCALEDMGFQTMGFAGGREDVWEPQQDVWWGPEVKWLDDKRYSGDRDLENPLAAVQMGLIYVNPEGPNGEPDPMKAAKDIRETFGRMAMNDEETVALIAGGHTFGKAHGAANPEGNVGPEPEGAPLEAMGFGWINKFGKGHSEDTITSGLEGAWTTTPAEWSHDYFTHLFEYEWEKTKSPAGATQWVPKDNGGAGTVPDAHTEETHQPIMFTTDLALKTDPAYKEISKRFYENPEEFEKAFAAAWYKLTHRDMGPHERLLGDWVAPPQLWQDPVPEADYQTVNDADVASLKDQILGSGLSVEELVETAWASASTFRGSDLRGGANGGRLALAPQNQWEANEPQQLRKVLGKLESIQKSFNENANGRKVSLADLIVLGGTAAVEKAAKDAGHDIDVPFTPGRTDATAEMTDVESFEYLRPKADGFRNYVGGELDRPSPEALVDRAQLLTLTAPEMTALVGGLRALGVSHNDSGRGVLTDTPGQLTNDFFVNLLDIGTTWKKVGEDQYESAGNKEWTASAVDLVFGSNSQLRAISEVYASAGGEDRFVRDFAAAWVKVMDLDRFDLDRQDPELTASR